MTTKANVVYAKQRLAKVEFPPLDRMTYCGAPLSELTPDERVKAIYLVLKDMMSSYKSVAENYKELDDL